MRFEVYFRCYRYLGRLLNLFNFISIINHLWHMGDRYLVTRTPDRMLMHWRRMQMYITYMGMFWGKTLWLVVCVLCGLGSWASDPQRGCGGLLDGGVNGSVHVTPSQGNPRWNKPLKRKKKKKKVKCDSELYVIMLCSTWGNCVPGNMQYVILCKFNHEDILSCTNFNHADHWNYRRNCIKKKKIFDLDIN